MKTTIFPSILLVILIGIISAAIFGTAGYFFGRELGSAIVYDASYEIGFVAAIEQNTEKGYQEGLIQGLRQGVSQAEENRLQIIRDRAFREGRDEGYINGYNVGFEQGAEENRIQVIRDQAFREGRDEGYLNGYNVGFEQGIDKGITESLIEGRNTIIENYFKFQRSSIISELTKQGYTCNNQNICERVFSDEPKIDRREWFVFNLNNMTHEFNVTYLSDSGSQMKQKVIVDYLSGQLTASWVSRSANFPNPPTLIYDFSTKTLTRNNTSFTNQNRVDWLFGWYNPRGLPIDESANLRWILLSNK
jgi:hypothetical protein